MPDDDDDELRGLLLVAQGEEVMQCAGVLAAYPLAARLSVCSTLLETLVAHAEDDKLTSSDRHVEFALEIVGDALSLPLAEPGVVDIADRALFVTLRWLARKTLSTRFELRLVLRLTKLFARQEEPKHRHHHKHVDDRRRLCLAAVDALRNYASCERRGPGASRVLARALVGCADQVLSHDDDPLGNAIGGVLFGTVVHVSLRALADDRVPDVEAWDFLSRRCRAAWALRAAVVDEWGRIVRRLSLAVFSAAHENDAKTYVFRATFYGQTEKNDVEDARWTEACLDDLFPASVVEGTTTPSPPSEPPHRATKTNDLALSIEALRFAWRRTLALLGNPNRLPIFPASPHHHHHHHRPRLLRAAGVRCVAEVAETTLGRPARAIRVCDEYDDRVRAAYRATPDAVLDLFGEYLFDAALSRPSRGGGGGGYCDESRCCALAVVGRCASTGPLARHHASRARLAISAALRGSDATLASKATALLFARDAITGESAALEGARAILNAAAHAAREVICARDDDLANAVPLGRLRFSCAKLLAAVFSINAGLEEPQEEECVVALAALGEAIATETDNPGILLRAAGFALRCDAEKAVPLCLACLSRWGPGSESPPAVKLAALALVEDAASVAPAKTVDIADAALPGARDCCRDFFLRGADEIVAYAAARCIERWTARAAAALCGATRRAVLDAGLLAVSSSSRGDVVALCCAAAFARALGASPPPFSSMLGDDDLARRLFGATARAPQRYARGSASILSILSAPGATEFVVATRDAVGRRAWTFRSDETGGGDAHGLAAGLGLFAPGAWESGARSLLNSEMLEKRLAELDALDRETYALRLRCDAPSADFDAFESALLDGGDLVLEGADPGGSISIPHQRRVFVVWNASLERWRNVKLPDNGSCCATIVVEPLLRSDLFRVALDHPDNAPFRCKEPTPDDDAAFLLGPLLDGAVVAAKDLAPLVRATAVAACEASLAHARLSRLANVASIKSTRQRRAEAIAAIVRTHLDPRFPASLLEPPSGCSSPPPLY
ncbi:hypothetical protein CTAYLR_001870 [Chrysophaeum taylorii]|uniref:Ral GTPase-activating protein subunit alpha/beta N-terminal domain-containing protein n=1 Tax=Chrysophaeum taylorii TaxID=2483200 RepID=A0AAD7U9W8_9STRA|nr:hypothetical protein CTAYLR_001870 [Chrysophaeum taylorii]